MPTEVAAARVTAAVPRNQRRSLSMNSFFAMASSAERLERRAELGREQLGLLPRREVAALVDDVEVDELAVGLLGPLLRGLIDLAGEHGDRGRKIDGDRV